MIRSTTDKMLAARFDPEPWWDSDGTRHATGGWSSVYAPRHAFIPPRDPEPYRCGAKSGYELRHQASDITVCPDPIFDPRPEYARPEPNPILVAMRRPHWCFSVNYAEWLAALDDQLLPDGTPHCWHHTQIVESGATPAQIEDARKVLTRLAELDKLV